MEINSKAEFETEVLKAEMPVLVSFFAVGCGPCRMMGRFIKQVERDKADIIKVVKVDVDKNKDIAIEYTVMSVPTLAIIKDGELKIKHTGIMSKEDLDEFIDEHK